jgi:hypothetical protein
LTANKCSLASQFRLESVEITPKNWVCWILHESYT